MSYLSPKHGLSNPHNKSYENDGNPTTCTQINQATTIFRIYKNVQPTCYSQCSNDIHNSIFCFNFFGSFLYLQPARVVIFSQRFHFFIIASRAESGFQFGMRCYGFVITALCIAFFIASRAEIHRHPICSSLWFVVAALCQASESFLDHVFARGCQP